MPPSLQRVNLQATQVDLAVGPWWSVSPNVAVLRCTLAVSLGPGKVLDMCGSAVSFADPKLRSNYRFENRLGAAIQL